MTINKFPLEVVCTDGIVFQEDVESVYLRGTEGEFELLPYHYPLVASLGSGNIEIAGKDPVVIRSGVVMFKDNQCTIIAEMDSEFKKILKGWS